jgi:iron complex transport system ATP-binding protein
MILDVSGLRFSYNSHPVLDGVGFALEKGQVLAVLGVNGAGKSTLLKCLNRVLRPQEGSALLDDEDLLAMSPRAVARRVGYVPQRHPDTLLNVYEAVLLGRKPHIGWTVSDADHQIVERVLDRMGLSDMALRPAGDLSGGEAQKVVIARALAQSPRVLLLDEPTSNLDLKNQLEVMGLIREIVSDGGLSAVASIHDLNLALRFADLFLFLKDHRVHALVSKEGLTADTIGEVYGVPVALAEVAGRTMVAPL